MVCVIHPEVEGEDLTAVVENIEGLVERGDGRVTHIEPWGMRRLAYPIKKVEDGQYMLLKLELDPQDVAAVDRGLQLLEPVIRHLIVSID